MKKVNQLMRFLMKMRKKKIKCNSRVVVERIL